MSFLTLSEFGAKYISSIVFCSVTITGLLLPLVCLAGKDQSHLVIGESIPQNYVQPLDVQHE